MKIKIHKGFRAVLSLLVTLMLLVGVVPLQAWQGTKADAVTIKETLTIYFDPSYTAGNNVAWNHGYLCLWLLYSGGGWYLASDASGVHESQSTVNVTREVTSLLGHGTNDPTAHLIKYTIAKNFVESGTGTLENIQFSYGANDGYGHKDYEDRYQMPIASVGSLSNGKVFYLNGKGREGGTYSTYSLTNSFNYTSCVPITNSNDFHATKDMNVIVDSAGTPAFSKDPERHYVSATLYDYFSDYEIKNGTTRTGGNGADVTNAGILTPYTWTDAERRMQHLTFDKALSDVYGNNSYQHPLYFGDIHHETDGYDFAAFNTIWGIVNQNHYLQLYHDNNSLRRNVSGFSDTDKAIPNVATTGLYKTSIGSYDSTKSNTENAQRLQLTNNAYARWFDDTWLSAGTGSTHNSTQHMIGASYDVDFPFWTKTARRKINGVQWAECNYFYIDSENADHALRLHKEYRTNKYYLKETKQGIYNFTGNDAKIFEAIQNNTAIPALNTTYGFFPFNSKSDFYDSSINNYDNLERADLKNLMDYQLRYDRTNYGFGTYMVIPFELNDNGTLYGTTDNNVDTPITFTFSGDDDLLVYVDGQLVLDIGGNHGKVEGEINFNLQKSWVSRVKSTEHNKNDGGATYGDNGEANAGDKYGYFTQNATLSRDLKTFSVVKSSGDGVRDISSVCGAGPHTMEIFYVERGDFDSNMEIMYNLPVKEDRSFTINQNIDMRNNVNPVFTDDTTFRDNVDNLTLEMDIQFSNPGTDTFDTLLEEQAYYYGRTHSATPTPPNQYTIATGSGTPSTQRFDNTTLGSGPKPDTYTVKMGNNQTVTYSDNFVKPYAYNMKVLQGGKVFIKGKEQTLFSASSLFNTEWTLKKYGSNENGYKGKGDNSGPVYITTSSSSRPARGTKTTSTSAGNSFDFHGTVENPDAIVFSNTMQTADLTINKTITDRKPSDESTNPLKFTVKVTFDDVGGIDLEDGRDANGDIITPRYIEKEYEISVDNTNSGSITIENIPVNTKYKIEETGNNSYTASYSGTVNTNWQTLTSSSGGEATVTNNYQQESPNPVAITLQIQKIWSDSTNMPEQVKFKLQYSEDGGSTWSNVTASSVINGDVTLTASTASVPNGGQRVVWTKSISDASICDVTSTGGDIKYRIQEYKSDGTTLITETGTEYDENWISNYNFSVGATIAAQNEKLGSQKGDNGLILAVLNTHPQNNPNTPETGGRGGYVPIAGGFIAILLAGAGYFIYKKRLLV